MSLYIIKTFPVLSHFNAILPLANALKKRNHTVIISGSRYFKNYIEGYNFEYEIDESGTQFNPFLYTSNPKRDKANDILFSQRSEPSFSAIDRQIKTQSRTHRNAYYIVDIHFMQNPAWVLQHGRRLSFFSTKVALDERKDFAPLTTCYISKGLSGRLLVGYYWKSYYIKRYISQAFGKTKFPRKKILAEACENAGIPSQALQLRRCLYPSIKGIPEFILSPKAFDPSYIPTPYQFYVSGLPLAPVSHKADDLTSLRYKLTSLRNRGAKIVYCSLGSMPRRYEKAGKFLVSVLDALKQCHWHLILVFPGINRKALQRYADKLFVYDYVPQMEILPLVDVMISHGGMNTIKECIINEVPLLIYPGSRSSDQYGNAARVVMHGIGLKGEMGADSPTMISKKVETLLKDRNFKRALIRMKKLITNDIESTNGALIVESVTSAIERSGEISKAPKS